MTAHDPLTVIHESERSRFTATVDGVTAVLSYRRIDDQTLDYRSTYVPPALRKRGIGLELVEFALAYARERGIEVVPTCWFVRDVVEHQGETGG